jgi:hypothetical protein
MPDDPAATDHTRVWREFRPGGPLPVRERVPVPAWFMDEVLEPVLADLQHPRPIDIVVEFKPLDDGGLVLFSERGEGGSFGLGIPRGETARSVLRAEWADRLQEQFFPETQGAWGEARPACPGHPHPARAIERAGEACWVCPADGKWIAEIGQLLRREPT